MERTEGKEAPQDRGGHHAVVDPGRQVAEDERVDDVLEHLAQHPRDADRHHVEDAGPEQAAEEILHGIEGVTQLVEDHGAEDDNADAEEGERSVEEEGGRHGGLRVFAVEGGKTDRRLSTRVKNSYC